MQPEMTSRRNFLRWATHGLGALFAAVLGIPAVAYLIDARNRPAPPSGFRRAAKFSEVLKDGKTTPDGSRILQVVIRDTRKDAWTLHPDEVIGRVWIVARDKQDLQVFTTICPHLGCSINFDGNAQQFICPCHGGTFQLNGARIELQAAKNPAPRGMDSLEWTSQPVENDEDDLEIFVKYENFKQGHEAKERKA
jgi:Rieske Fe-S protein